ncbi:2,3-dihydro-2,3-dihydroxybenzoate dehydrogenase [compost metagenome]
MQWSLWNDNSGEKTVIDGDLETYRLGIPLSKLAEPSDVAEAVLFLASDRSKHITMQNLYVDGGASLGG